MRLIDADALIEDLDGSMFYSDAIPFVEDAPTAYDVDKVVEELEQPNNYTIVAGKHFTTVERAIEIVKKGGINHENTAGNPGEP